MERMAERTDRPTVHDRADSDSCRLPEFATGTARPNLSVRIHNLDEIGRAYGARAIQAAADHVRSILKFQLRGGNRAELAEYVLRTLSERPVTYDGQRFHLVVSLAPTGDTTGCASIMSTGRGNPAFPDDAWCRHYRADMALAVNLFDAMAEGRIALAWQPVCDADDPLQILYHECLLRRVDPEAVDAESALDPAGDSIEALERLGLVRALDRFVMAETIGELRSDAFRTLAVNISAQSLADDHWWANTLAALAQSPLLARRLTVEITETASFASVAEAANFVARLRRLGCRIALDDFGTGHAAIRSVLALNPDIIKIDKFFVGRAGASPAGLRTLAHLIGLAESLGAIAIVEGIETATDSLLSREAGARWQQGYYHGRPSISRPWRTKASCSADVASEGNNGSYSEVAGDDPFHRGAAEAPERCRARVDDGNPGAAHLAAVSLPDVGLDLAEQSILWRHSASRSFDMRN